MNASPIPASLDRCPPPLSDRLWTTARDFAAFFVPPEPDLPVAFFAMFGSPDLTLRFTP
jgi:hypothetical protein